MKISLSAKPRTIFKKKTKHLKYEGRIPAVVYGQGEKNKVIDVEEREFKKVYNQAGESALIELEVEGVKEKKSVLVHELQKNPITGHVIHIDFFQPSLKEEVQVAVPLIFEGVAPAEKDLGGTLNKNFMELEVKALPQNLPQEITVDISSLKTFEDHILVKDLKLPANVTAVKDGEEIVASVLPPQDVEAELAKEIKEDVESIEKVEKPEKEEEVVEAPDEPAAKKEEAK